MKIHSGFFLILLVLIPVSNHAQSVRRQCISSYGTIFVTENTVFMQTVGQPFNTTASYENETVLLPGFQQPVVLKAVSVSSELTKNIEFNAYPNPASHSVTIQSGEVIENAVISVIDLSGRLILSEKLVQLQTYDINCAAWKSGIYILIVSDNDLIKSSFRLTINK
ncbi:MAG: T9SS type A sorting domain-containing protein [Bacteroidales bacterium]|nr:T9SS type A sorting domain-containing protein [Bacteroidales bacterium]